MAHNTAFSYSSRSFATTKLAALPSAVDRAERSSPLPSDAALLMLRLTLRLMPPRRCSWCGSSAVVAVVCVMCGASKAAADRRRLFPEGELRETLDEFTDAITKRQRNPGGLMAPPSRSVRERERESDRLWGVGEGTQQ